MASDSIHVVDPPAKIYLRLWLIAIVGLLAPGAFVLYWPDFGWVGTAARAHAQSLKEEQWQDPWLAIDQKTFSSGWIRCESLENAIKLDKMIDDGHPHTGRLVLSEGGLAWLAEE